MSKNLTIQSRGGVRGMVSFLMAFVVAAPLTTLAAGTNAVSPLLVAPSLPDTGPSLLRVLGALALVLGIFLGGVWFYRNARRMSFRRGRAPRLDVLEVRSLGGRQAIYVVGYDQERFLVGSSPTGLNLLTHLPSATEQEAKDSAQPQAALPFAQALAQMLRGPARPGGVKE